MSSVCMSRSRVGRARPRSRFGCITCKKRHVRCDEVHPVCGHCARLQLECIYQPPQRKRRHAVRVTNANASEMGWTPASSSQTNVSFAIPQSNLDSAQPPEQNQAIRDFALSDAFGCADFPGVGWNELVQDTSTSSGLALGYGMLDFGTPWAGQMCSFPSFPVMSPSHNSVPMESAHEDEQPVSDAQTGSTWSQTASDTGGHSGTLHSRPGYNPSLSRCRRQRDQGPGRGAQVTADSVLTKDKMKPPGEQSHSRRTALSHNLEESKLVSLFQKITQPPAAILIGGVRKWQHLQHYLINLSTRSQSVCDALLCLIELLTLDETSQWPGQSPDTCMARILERHESARLQIERTVSRPSGISHDEREQALAAFFLLAWFEVVRDQNDAGSLFPRHLADAIITNESDWNRYSKQLLSWLHTLDSKASHLGSEPLLPSKALDIVSQHPNQIIGCNDEDLDDGDGPVETDSPVPSPSSPACPRSCTSLSGGHIKQIVLRAVLQPALEWYLASQTYCRRIRSHDKHHRQRFTPDDEYEVIIACKQLETELWEFWGHRPSILSLHAADLATTLAPDVAVRVEEIFCIYRASFWILFVYLHRVSWWGLALSPMALDALRHVWSNMQRAYGEVVDNGRKKVVHPALLWPLFLFGSECVDERQRKWAIEQLEALGEAKPVVVAEDDRDGDGLRPFQMSSGATRNAKRAALLLRELVKKQDELKTRVDDRDLSMELFGCYFSIV